METKKTDDRRTYAAETHFNGSQHVAMPPGIYHHIAKRVYVDENGKEVDWNPNFPDEKLPAGVKPGWYNKKAKEEKEPADSKPAKAKKD